MSFGIAAAVVGAVGAGLSVYSAYKEGQAAKKAAKQRAAGVQGLETVDLEELKKLVEDTDLERYRRAFSAQAEIDPEFAKLRQEGAKSLLEILASDKEAAKAYSPALAGLIEKTANDRDRELLINQLTARAQQHLAEGAKLPADIQAELVRAGLERAGTSGFSVEGRGAGGVSIRQLLGTAGLQLQAAREQAAASLAQTASVLRQGQTSALQSLLALDQQLRQARGQLAGAALTAGSSALPSIGLTGGQLGDVYLANQELLNKKTLALADAKAAQTLASGQMFSGLLGSITGGLGSLIGILKGGTGEK